MDIETTIRNYIPQVVHMSLSTYSGSKPWISEVHFAYDDNLNIYFMSFPTRRHSKEISENPNVAGNIVTQHYLEQKVRCVSFEGTAEQLDTVDETHPAYLAMHHRFGLGPTIIDEMQNEGGSRCYKITVSDFYVFDSYISNPPQKYHLAWSKS